ncbi:MAG: N-acetylmuramoyl-L-alanine amidase [Proteobacteria bacterium]|jgi:N-acetylmuramoyl-L-alanine amidase|nr:N-acetylmuramoyl-L-alanine amidase [Pseudomonadota bacterium]
MARTLGRPVAIPLIALLLAVGLVAAGADERPKRVIRRVALDPGHGGDDYGARGASGLLEKDVVLAVAQAIGRALEKEGIEVVYTRSEDVFVTLPERTELANRAGADLYLSIHANSSRDPGVRGPETYFLSLEASDDEARRVAVTENGVFDHDEAAADSGDLVGAILGDLIRTDHLRASSEAAIAIQRELERLPGPERGVKQAPFVVLMGVNMPAALLEIGFLTHPDEERALAHARGRDAIARAVAKAVLTLRRRQEMSAMDGGAGQ